MGDSLDDAAREIEEMWARCADNIDEAMHFIAKAKEDSLDLHTLQVKLSEKLPREHE